MPASDLPTFPAKIKIENLEDGSASFSDNNMGKLSYYRKILLKSEMGVYDVSSEDILDHLTLLQRMRLLIPEKCLNLLDTGDLKCTMKSIDSTHERSPAISESHTTRGISYRRKRKRTATDSVETALEEDAPGLLKVLMDKGIAIDEMKLYGDPESADLLDASTDDDSFQDLEAVMSKVGEDLTEAEAKVLEEYGWTRNSGLASMLNYCDRVIHDRNKDRDVSEWRSKIGKLLMDGINGGVIVLANLPNKFMGPESSPAPEIKLELI
ncbi:hypothetical protein Scep_022774 [Stephania cephalantha]|uniref:Uncharacterized protein n=1 Tax=Stephania cephalantha TaxID=152367 RepID=A0AAP0I2I6_9MAGN